MSIDNLPEITLDQVKAFRRATGCPVSKVEAVLLAMAPALRLRVLKAIETQSGPMFYDPIEDDPGLQSTIDKARQDAEEIVNARGLDGQRGTCYLLWSEQARLLKERHNIVWFSRAAMNPGTVFD